MMYNVTCSDTDAWSNIVVFFSLDKPENVKVMVNDSAVCKGDVISITCSADGKPAVHINFINCLRMKYPLMMETVQLGYG